MRALFLDRDGTVCKDKGYSNKVEELEIYAGVKEKLKLIKRYGFFVFVVSNQAGASFGYHTKDDIELFNAYLDFALDRVIDKIYFCAHPPNFDCACRKPKTGLVDTALHEFPVNPSLSWMVGDKDSDVKLGKYKGMKTVLVLTGHGKKRFALEAPDFVAFDLPQAIDIILRTVSSRIKPLTLRHRGGKIYGVLDLDLEGFFVRDIKIFDEFMRELRLSVVEDSRIPVDFVLGLGGDIKVAGFLPRSRIFVGDFVKALKDFKMKP